MGVGQFEKEKEERNEIAKLEFWKGWNMENGWE